MKGEPKTKWNVQNTYLNSEPGPRDIGASKASSIHAGKPKGSGGEEPAASLNADADADADSNPNQNPNQNPNVNPDSNPNANPNPNSNEDSETC